MVQYKGKLIEIQAKAYNFSKDLAVYEAVSCFC